MAHTKTTLVPYDKGGIRARLPKWLRIKEFPDGIVAEATKRGVGLSILVSFRGAAARNREVLRNSCDKPTPMITCRLIRDVDLAPPVKGWDIIVEHKVIEIAQVSYYWDRCVYPDDEYAIEASVHSLGKLSEEESMWLEVFESIVFDREAFLASSNEKPDALKEFNISTENNMFSVGPKELCTEAVGELDPGDSSIIPFMDPRDLAQGFAAWPEYVSISLPGDSMGCDVKIEYSKSIPDLKRCVQAFCVPITVKEDDFYSHAVSGVCNQIDVKDSAYDMVVRLFKGKQDGADWLATLTFLPAGTVGPKVFKLLGQSVPDTVFIHQD